MVRLIQQSRERGLATIEMALVAPLLMLLTLGAIEYGWMFLKAQQVTNAARQGARVGAPPDGTNADVQSAVDTVMNGAGMNGTGYTVTINPSVTGLAPETTFSVTVSVPYTNVTILGTIPFLPAPTNLRALVSMAKEGP